MNNTINNQAKGAEYSEYYRNLRKEVSEQNVKTAQLPQSLLVDYLEKQTNDKVEFNNYNKQIFDVGVEKLKENDILSAVTSLVVAIKQNSGSAYESQNNLLLSRIAAILKS